MGRFHEIEETVEVVDAIPTDLLTLSGNLRDTAVVVVPGNPGYVGFYKCFMTAVHTLLSKDVSVMTVGLAGYLKTPLSQPKYYDLEDQVRAQ